MCSTVSPGFRQFTLLRVKLFVLLVAVALGLFESCDRNRNTGLQVDPGIENELRQIPAMPAPLHPGSPYFVEAWRALFDHRVAGATSDDLAVVARSRRLLKQQNGNNYPSFILNKTNTAIMLANRIAMGRGLPEDRFQWVPFADCFLFPLDNTQARSVNPDRDVFLRAESVLLQHQLSAAQLSSFPPTLDDYLTFVSHTLESWKASGAVALKFEIAYLRNLNIGDPACAKAIGRMVLRGNAHQLYGF